jgi:hypothetical protein
VVFGVMGIRNPLNVTNVKPITLKNFIPLCLDTISFDKDVAYYVLPVFTFITLYSLLPHKVSVIII